MEIPIKEEHRVYIVLALYLVAFFILAGGLKSIPSCMFGCDYYFEQGNVLSLAGNFTLDSASSSHLGHLSNGPQLYYYVASAFVRAGLNIIQTSLVLSVILIVLALLVYYRLFRTIFEEKEAALLSAVIAFSLPLFPIFKYSEFTAAFSVPVFLYAFFYYLRRRDWKSGLALGITTGIMGLSHTNAFFLPYVFMASYAIYTVASERSLRTVLDDAPRLGAAALIGFVISLVWWFKPLFVFHGNAYLGWGFNTYDLTNFATYIWLIYDLLRRTFFDLSGLKAAAFSLINIAGVYYLISQWRKGAVKKEVAIFAIAFLIAVFHFVVTSPLLGKDFSPDHSFEFLIAPFTAFMAGNLLSEQRARRFALAFIIAIVLINASDTITKSGGSFFKAGYSPVPEPYASAASWIDNNTNVETVFLSTNELCFAVNGLTGRKCMVMRRGHSSKFDEMDSSYTAAAVILYGNDTAEKLSLLREFNVSYIYWDQGWISTEYFTTQSGQLAWSDPLAIIDSPEREAILRDNGVNYTVMTTWLDPAFRDWRYRKFRVIFVTPENYYALSHPWKPDLDPYLQPVWSYGGQATIYKVVLPPSASQAG